MLKQINFTTDHGVEYIMLNDSTYLTDEQAVAECEFVGFGGGCNYKLFPYYVIIEKQKEPILKCIKDHISGKHCGGASNNDV